MAVAAIVPFSRHQQQENNAMKKLLILVSTSLVVTMQLAGCNTMSGAGQDIQKAGQKIEDAADRKK